jgi:spore coat protein U-like protein
MNATVRDWKAFACVAAALLAAAGGAAAQTCNFRSPLPGGILFSPALDPSSASTRTATTDIRVQCTGNALLAWSFTGANGSSQLQMRHGSLPAVIPYTVEASFRQGPVGNQQWVLTATVLGTAYVNAPAGTYTDQLTATVLP